MAEQQKKMSLALVLLLSLVIMQGVQGQLSAGFYANKCPPRVKVEKIVRNVITTAFKRDPGVAPGIIRMHFHDCFVQGCDGSVLINAAGSERSARPNQSLRQSAFDAIDAAKAAVEARCPGVVSCADILTFAARDSVLLTMGVGFKVTSGRFDGKVSNQADVSLPGPFQAVDALTAAFAKVGLSQRDMVVLSGAHTIGIAHCPAINSRLYTFNSTHPTDPSLDPAYAATLKAQCPQGTTDTSIQVNMDPQTPLKFDNAYYANLQLNKGLFTSDQSLFTDAATRPLVNSFAASSAWRTKEYRTSFNRMAAIGIKTAAEGEIRRVCSAFNS